MSPATTRILNFFSGFIIFSATGSNRPVPHNAGQSASKSVNMLASWPDDGPDARKYELSYGRSRTNRLSHRLQGLFDPAEPLSSSSADRVPSQGLMILALGGACLTRATCSLSITMKNRTLALVARRRLTRLSMDGVTIETRSRQTLVRPVGVSEATRVRV